MLMLGSIIIVNGRYFLKFYSAHEGVSVAGALLQAKRSYITLETARDVPIFVILITVTNVSNSCCIQERLAYHDSAKTNKNNDNNFLKITISSLGEIRIWFGEFLRLLLRCLTEKLLNQENGCYFYKVK